MTVCIVQIPQRFIVLYNMSPLSAGARLLPFSLMVPVGSVVSAVLLDRKIVSINLLLCVGGALQTVGVALFANLSSSAGNLGRQYGFQIIIGIGLGCVSTATFLLVPIKLEKRDLGKFTLYS
jgi:ABC-type enterobactin transport system permease subunit